MKRSWAPVKLLAAGILAAAVFAAAPGIGQQPQGKAPPQLDKTAARSPEEKYVDAVTLPRNPESKRLIQAAQDYVKKKEWKTAGDCLQSLLETPEDSFIEVIRKNEAGQEITIKVSVRSEANRIIGELPAEGLESYQVQYGPRAAERLKLAIEKADPALLAEVSQRYLNTKAGLEATQLLGTYHLDRGQYLMASLCFERLLNRPDADQLPAKTLFRAALAYHRAGNSAMAEKLWNKFTEKLGRAELTLGKLRLSADQLRGEFVRDVGVELAARLFDWPIFRGNVSRSAQGQGSTAYLQPRWTADMIPKDDPLSAQDQFAIKWIDDHLKLALQTLKDKPILPAYFPIAAHGRLIVRTYDGVAAYALVAEGAGQKPGDLLWRSSPPDNSLLQTLRDMSGKHHYVTTWYNQYLQQNGAVGPVGVFFENAIIGSLSHDGQRVYFIDDLAVPPPANAVMTMGFGFQPGIVPQYGPFTNDIKHNRLCAVDLDTGKLSWPNLGEVAPPSAPGAAEPVKDPARDLDLATEMLDTYFLGPPLPLGGKLYMLVEKKSELRLACIDPNNRVPSAINPKDLMPQLNWVQTLGIAKEALPGDTLRRLQAAHLAYADGILVCPTNAGAILGVDLLSHSLVWAFSYRKTQNISQENTGGRFPFRNAYPAAPSTGERWRPSAPCIVKGKVVFTAPDAPDSEIHCLNLRDGRRLWSTKRDEANDLYLAGVFDDRVVIVAKNHVRALALDTGNVVWRRDDTGMPSGQGVAADGVYYLPLAASSDPKSADKSSEICALSIATGKPVGRSKSRKDTPGNLLFMEGELISQTPRAIVSYPLLKVKQAEISSYLAKNPRDPTGLTERGELHLYNGEVRDAVGDLRTALANEPPTEVRTKARTKLHEALTLLFQSDFNGAEQFLGEYEELCQVPVPSNADAAMKSRLEAEGLRRRASYLELLGRGRERQGRLLDAFRAYEQYGTLTGHAELVDSIEEPNTKARPDVWSRGRIQALLTKGSASERKQLEDEIGKRWEAVRSGSLEVLSKFVVLYGSISKAGQLARLELVKKLLESGDPDNLTEAERLLAGVCYAEPSGRDDPAMMAQALELMIRVCLRRGQYENAVAFFRRLAQECPDVPVRDGRTGKQLYDELITDKRIAPYLDSTAVIWSGPLSGKRLDTNSAVQQASLTLDPPGERSVFLERNRVALDWPMNNQRPLTLRVVDRGSGEERWRPPSELPKGDLSIVNNIAATQFAYVRGHVLILQLNSEVRAFDLAAQRELWTKDLAKDAGLAAQQSIAHDAFGPMMISADQRKIYLGRIAVAESSYVALQTRDGLMVVDPVLQGSMGRPSVMWLKSDVTPKAQVFGDDRTVFVFDPDAPAGRPKCQALRAEDGAPMPVGDFTEFFQKQKLRTIGRRLLLGEPGKCLRLWDVVSAKEVWRKDLPAGAVIVKCDDSRWTGAIEPGGLFTLLDARSGEVQFTTRMQADHAEKLQSVTLFADRNRFYLMLTQNPEGSTWACAAGPYIRSIPVNGRIYAMDRASGKLEWVSESIPHQSFLLEQWSDLPVLLLASNFSQNSPKGELERQGVKVTAIEKKTGKLRFDEDLVRHSDFTLLTANASAGRIELTRNDAKVIFTTPEAAALPPEPPTPTTRTGAASRINTRPIPVMPLPAPAPPNGGGR